ncbi:MAG TPA: gliding motility lipoprotein GldH [Cytophagales bacterium]|nr:gliding motility lipoprotein GldH [Cytophagales bacterium]
MRIFTVLILLSLFSCDQSRVYEQQVDFPDKAWLVSNQPRFEFEIKDHTRNYNLYYTVRNSLEFPFSRIFVTYTLSDSTSQQQKKDLLSAYLFDQKTGEPFGDSGIGDLFDHRFPIVTNYHFDRPGKYFIQLEQFNRLDTLKGIMAVGIRVETTSQE